MKSIYEYLLSNSKKEKVRTFPNDSFNELYNNLKSFINQENKDLVDRLFDNLEYLSNKYNLDKLLDCMSNIINNYVKDNTAIVYIQIFNKPDDKSNSKRYDVVFKFEEYRIQISFYEHWSIIGVKFISKYDSTINYERKTTKNIKSKAYWHWTESITDDNVEIASYCIKQWNFINSK